MELLINEFLVMCLCDCCTSHARIDSLAHLGREPALRPDAPSKIAAPAPSREATGEAEWTPLEWTELAPLI